MLDLTDFDNDAIDHLIHIAAQGETVSVTSEALMSLVREVKRHRTAALTEEEKEAMNWVTALLRGYVAKLPGYETRVVLALIERLLNPTTTALPP